MNDNLLQEAIVSLRRMQLVNYLNVASVALMAYDFFLTLPNEIRLIWPSKLTTGKVLFFLVRYTAFIDGAFDVAYLTQHGLSIRHCKPYYYVAAWMMFTGIVFSEIIMTMQTCAVWGRSRHLLIFLIVINIGFIVPDIILLQKSLGSLSFIPSPSPDLTPCILRSADKSVSIDYLLIIAYESIITSMLLLKCYEHWRENRGSLVNVIIRNGVQYYLCIFATSLANLLVVKMANIIYSDLLLELQRVLHSILTARMLLDIRQVVEQKAGSSIISPINFAGPLGKATSLFEAEQADTVGRRDGDSTNSRMFESSIFGSSESETKNSCACQVTNEHLKSSQDLGINKSGTHI